MLFTIAYKFDLQTRNKLHSQGSSSQNQSKGETKVLTDVWSIVFSSIHLLMSPQIPSLTFQEENYPLNSVNVCNYMPEGVFIGAQSWKLLLHFQVFTFNTEEIEREGWARVSIAVSTRT